MEVKGDRVGGYGISVRGWGIRGMGYVRGTGWGGGFQRALDGRDRVRLRRRELGGDKLLALVGRGAHVGVVRRRREVQAGEGPGEAPILFGTISQHISQNSTVARFGGSRNSTIVTQERIGAILLGISWKCLRCGSGRLSLACPAQRCAKCCGELHGLALGSPTYECRPFPPPALPSAAAEGDGFELAFAGGGRAKLGGGEVTLFWKLLPSAAAPASPQRSRSRSDISSSHTYRAPAASATARSAAAHASPRRPSAAAVPSSHRRPRARPPTASCAHSTCSTRLPSPRRAPRCGVRTGVRIGVLIGVRIGVCVSYPCSLRTNCSLQVRSQKEGTNTTKKERRNMSEIEYYCKNTENMHFLFSFCDGVHVAISGQSFTENASCESLS